MKERLLLASDRNDREFSGNAADLDLQILFSRADGRYKDIWLHQPDKSGRHTGERNVYRLATDSDLDRGGWIR